MTRCERCGYASASYSEQDRAWLCPNCYLGPLPPKRRLSGGTIAANDTLSTSSETRPETPVAKGRVTTTTATTRTTTTSREEGPQRLEDSASAGGATESRESPNSRSGSEYFQDLEAAALKFGAKPVALDLPDDLAPIVRGRRRLRVRRRHLRRPRRRRVHPVRLPLAHRCAGRRQQNGQPGTPHACRAGRAGRLRRD
jgi:hypothetical protein